MNNKRLLRYGHMLILRLLLQSTIFTSVYGQSIVPNYGAPASALNVCAGPATFNVQLNGGVSASGTLNITLPTGYVYTPNSHAVVSGGLTITQSSAAGNLATLQVGNIPAGVSEFSYQASAGCGAIGASGSNQVTYKLGSNPDVWSNPVNALNAKLNITSVTNSAYVAGTLGAVYTRAITIQNGGFGSVSELNLTSTFTGLGIGNITTSAGSVIVTRGLVGPDSVIHVKISPAGGTFAPNATVVVTESVTVTGCSGGSTAYDAWFGCPDKCTQSNANGTATAGATISVGSQPSVVLSMISDPLLKCLPAGANDGWVVCQAKNTSTATALVSLLLNYGLTSCSNCPGPVPPTGGVGGNTCSNRTMYIDTAAGVQMSMNGGATWTNANDTVFQWYDAWPAGGGYNAGKPIALRFPGITQVNGGDSIRIRFKIHDQVPTCCNADWYQGYFSFGGSYTDVCGNNRQTMASAITSSGTAQRYSMNSTSASDAVAGQPYFLTFQGFIIQQDKAVRTAPDGYVDYEVTLPTSLDPSLVAADHSLSKGATTLVPDNVTWDPALRKLRLRFLRGAFGSLTGGNDYGNWGLSAKTTVNCAGTGSSASLSAYVKLADCAATEWQALCNIPATFTTHGCMTAACEGPKNFATTVQRTNYGIYSSGNDGIPSGSLDTGLLNLERTLYGDTIAVTTRVKMQGIGTYSNMYVRIDKSEPDATHTFVDARAYVYNSTTGSLTATITGITAGDVTGSYPSTRTVSLTTGTGAPPAFAPDDSIVVVTRFRQLITTDKRVDFTTTTYALNSASSAGLPQISCDGHWTGTAYNFGTQLGGFNYPTLNFNGCTTIAQPVTISYIINPGAPAISRHSRFSYEVRKLFDLDTLALVVPADFEITNMDISVAGQGSIAFAGIASYPLLSYNAATNTYLYSLTNLADQLIAPGIPFSEGFSLNITPTFKVKCKSGNFAGTDNIATVNLRSRSMGGPWSNIGGAYYLGSTNGTFNPLSMSSASPDLTANGNIASWEVQVSNPTTVAKPNAWIAKAPGVSTVTITNIQELTGAGGSVANTANITNGIFELGPIPAGTSKYYRVNATFTNCIADSIKLGYDFNCDAYPASIATGVTGCRYQTLALKVNAQPTGVQTTIISQPPNTPLQLCSVLPYEVEIRNPALGTLMDTLTLRMQLPVGVNYGGVQFVPGSAQVQVPNASYPNGPYTVLPNSVQSYQQVSGGGNFMIIKIPPVILPQLGALEALRVKFEVRTTSCDFVSGSSIKFRGEGRNACDQTITSAYQQAQNVKIAGAPNNPILFILDSKADSVATCSAGNVTTQYRFSMINNGPAATDTNYKFRIALPAPWTLDLSSVNFAINTGTTPVYVNQTGGFYNFKAGANLAIGDSVVMTATLIAPSAQLTCGISDAIKEEVLVTFSTICIVDTSICADMGAITSEREVTTVVVERPTYSITAFNGSPSGNPPNHLAGSFTLQHNNAIYTLQNGVLKVYKDVDQDGILDGGDVLLGSQTHAIAGLASQTFNYDITASGTNGNICPVIATMEMDCVCEVPTFIYNCNNVVLPIKFKDEKVTANACQVNLSWNYEANQAIVTGFTIERSNAANAGNKWEKVGTAHARVTKFTDAVATSGKWLYRIKATSADYDEVYSRVLSVNTTCSGAMVKIFPNPANDVMNIAVQGTADLEISYIITDNLGRVIKQGQFSAGKVAQVNIRDIAGGLYQVRVVYGGNVYVQQVDIVK